MSRFYECDKIAVESTLDDIAPINEGVGLAVINIIMRGLSIPAHFTSQRELDSIINKIGHKETLILFFDTLMASIKDKYKASILKAPTSWKIWSSEYLDNITFGSMGSINGYHIILHPGTDSDFNKQIFALALFDTENRYKDDMHMRLMHFKITDSGIVTQEKHKCDDTLEFIDTKKLKLPYMIKFK